MTTKIQPQEMAAYLDSVRPMMEGLYDGCRVDVFGTGKYLRVMKVEINACMIQVLLTNLERKWIRVEQIEYVYPY